MYFFTVFVWFSGSLFADDEGGAVEEATDGQVDAVGDALQLGLGRIEQVLHPEQAQAWNERV